MPLDPSLEGRRLPSRSIVVSAEHARAFAGAVGDGADHVPPTFVTTLQIGAAIALAGDPEIGIDLSRVLHGEEEYVWHRPLEVGEELTAAPRIARVVARGEDGFVTIESTITGADGTPVVEARTVLIVRGSAAEQG
jgi:acyl dehydratase